MQTNNEYPARNIEVLVVGQTPPPYHGQAIAIAELVNAPWQDITVSHVRMAYSRSAQEVGRFGIMKIWHLLQCARQTVKELKNNSNLILYYPPGGDPVPIIRDILFMFLVRRHAHRLVLHFHACGMADTFARKPWIKKAAINAFGKVDAAIRLQPSIPPDAESLCPRRLFTVPNGLDVPAVSPSPKTDGSAVRILFAGIHTEEKGIFIVVEALARLLRMGLDAEVHTMGSWRSKAEKEKCLQFVQANNLEGRIRFNGSLTGRDKWQEYADADLFFFPTFYSAELMPLVAIEAMAFSLPVVASEWRGLTDMIDDGKNGYLFPVKNVGTAVEKLARLVRDRELRRQIGEDARLCYEKYYTLSAHLQAMRDVFYAVAES